MTFQDLYNFIIDSYGRRGAWISDIANQLNIRRDEANHLTYAMGYRKGKMFKQATYQEFCSDTGVKLIQAKLI